MDWWSCEADICAQAEYLPLPTMPTRTNEYGGTDLPFLLSNLLLSVLPNVPDARIVAVTIGYVGVSFVPCFGCAMVLTRWVVRDSQWEEMLWDEPDEDEEQKPAKKEEDDIYAEDDDQPATRKGDWEGVERDRRSAYLIIGALKQEGLL